MNQELITAIETIKTAILQSQYQAAKETTRVQLILYYGIGHYLSSKKGKKTWGTSVLETISSQLRKNLPVLHCVEGSDGWQISSKLEVGDSRIFSRKS